MGCSGFFKQIYDTISTDVLVIGAGAAGLRAAMEAFDNGVKVLVVCKGNFLKTGSTFFSLVPGWGMQFLEKENADNTYEYFLKEILEVGDGMADPYLAKILIEKSPKRVYELENMGIKFDKIDGKFYEFLCCFANIKRTVACALDLKNIRLTFKKEIIKRNIKVIENFFVIKIVTKEECKNKKVCGAIGIDQNGNLVFVKANAVILASGGGSIIFKNNMNSPELTGDGYELALDAGASLINMEYIQFIYGIVAPKKIHFSEKVFMFKPPILNKYGITFIEKYIPSYLSIDDVINKRIEHGPFTSRLISKYFDIAIYSEIRNGKGTENNAIFLDLRKLPEYIDNIEKDFPSIKKWLKWLYNNGVDVQKEFLEIALCAHANNGGILVNVNTMTEIDGLFACGEIMGGPHGADRQGGNMMAATQVFGKIAGKNAAKYTKICSTGVVNENYILSEINKKIKLKKNGSEDYKYIKNEIQEYANKELVICRSAKGLKSLIEKFDGELQEKINFIKIGRLSDIRNYFNLKSMLNTALIIANAAMLRKESRGSHHREDYQEKDDKEFRKVIKINRENDKYIYNFIKF